MKLMVLMVLMVLVVLVLPVVPLMLMLLTRIMKSQDHFDNIAVIEEGINGSLCWAIFCWFIPFFMCTAVLVPKMRVLARDARLKGIQSQKIRALPRRRSSDRHCELVRQQTTTTANTPVHNDSYGPELCLLWHFFPTTTYALYFVEMSSICRRGDGRMRQRPHIL